MTLMLCLHVGGLKKKSHQCKRFHTAADASLQLCNCCHGDSITYRTFCKPQENIELEQSDTRVSLLEK